MQDWFTGKEGIEGLISLFLNVTPVYFVRLPFGCERGAETAAKLGMKSL